MDQQVQEQYRQQYLAAMGVTSWLPLDALPGAAPSPQWVWQSAQSKSPAAETVSSDHSAISAPTAAAKADPATHSDARKTTAALQQMLSGESARAATRASVTAASEVSSPDSRLVSDVSTAAVANAKVSDPASTQSPSLNSDNDIAPPQSAAPDQGAEQQDAESRVPRFRLAVLAYKDCLVVNELPLDVLQGMTAKHQQLLQRILASIGLGQGDANVQLLAWPVVNSAHIDQGEPVARAGVNNLIVRMQSNAQLPMLLMGQSAVSYGLPESYRQADTVTNVANRWVLPAPSLNELMCIPGLKRELWLQLLQLQKHLTQ